MTTRSRWFLVSAVFSACVVLGSAAAQTPGTAGTVDVKAGSSVTSGDQAALAEQYVTKMQTAASRIRHLLDEARRQKDVVKTTCLSDKLAQIEVGIRSAKEREKSLNAAIARSDTDVRNHEFAVMNVLRQRAEQLDAEASQCIGEELGFPGGDTRISFAVDPNIAPVDPGTGGEGGDVIYVPPVPASGSSPP